MLKLSLLTEQKDKPVTSFERKVIKWLETNFGDYDATEIYYDVHHGLNMVDMLINYLLIPYENAVEIYYLYNNNLKEIRTGDDSWLKNPARGYLEDASAEQMALAKHLKLPPNFLNDENSYYGMVQFVDEDSGHLYAVGDEEDIRNAIEDMADNLLWGLQNDPTPEKFFETEYSWNYGYSELPNYLYIADWAIEDISKEDAHREIEDWYGNTPEDLLTQIAQKRPDIEKEWEDLQGRRDDLEEMLLNSDNDNQADLLQDKIDEIDIEIERLSEVAKDDIALELSNNNREWMERNPLEWLHEFGYIGMDDNGKYEIERYVDYYAYPKEKKTYPDWLRVDSEKLKEDLVERLYQYRAEELARYDGTERTEEYNGETYYIYKTE